MELFFRLTKMICQEIQIFGDVIGILHVKKLFVIFLRDCVHFWQIEGGTCAPVAVGYFIKACPDQKVN